MRILLVSDIHANRAALDAVREPHDVCLCLGDLVEYGPDPAYSVAWARANAAHAVRGNHDHGAAQRVAVTATGGFKYLTMATRQYTIDQLGPADRTYLAGLPTTVLVTLGGRRFLLVHASPRDPMDEYVPTDPDAWAARLGGVTADFVCVGHTHQQFALDADGTTVVNPGSVGLQRDGDPRVRYAVIDDGRVELKQVAYDPTPTIAAVDAAPLSDRAKAMLRDVYRHGRYAKPGAPVPAGNGPAVNGSATNGTGHHPFAAAHARPTPPAVAAYDGR